jgi:hypothetical protein
MPRLRQAVLAARELEPTVTRIREALGLGEPYRDPAVGYFGLANAVFAVGDTFLEIISPVDPGRPGARTALGQLERSGAAVCGYMAMLQVEALAPARERARAATVREVFEVELEDIAEVHLHPGDMRGAIVSLSEPHPPESWRWGGDGWRTRTVAGGLTAITVAVADPDGVSARWEGIAGGSLPQCRFAEDARAPGIVEIELQVGGHGRTVRPDRI